MMNKVFLHGKILLIFVERGCGRDVVNASKQGCARGGTKLLGQGLGVLGAIDASCTECCGQDIVLIVMHEEVERVIDAITAGSFHPKTGYSGTAVVLDAPKTLMHSGLTSGNTVADFHTTGEKNMCSGYTMISSIINYGQAEELMAVARKAGAKGGTILNARGTGTEEDVKFFGISLAHEKEFLLIITENAHADAILDAIASQPVFSEPGGGIIFTTSVDSLFSLGC